MQRYRCTRNDVYKHDCIGRDDLQPRQGHYVLANSEEEAWEIMASRYPEETTAGFTVEPWEGGNVTVVEIKRDKDGNVINE